MNKNIEDGFVKMMGKMYDKALKEAQKRDDCRYCHEPFLSLGLAKDIDSEAIAYLNVLRENDRIKFCPVCGRDLNVESYVDKTYEALRESKEAIKKVDGLLRAKKIGKINRKNFLMIKIIIELLKSPTNPAL